MDKEFFAQAAEEVADGNVDGALFVKALALAEGDEKKGRALYIQLRAEELRAESRRNKVVGAAAVTAGAVIAVAAITPWTRIAAASLNLFIPGAGHGLVGREDTGRKFIIAAVLFTAVAIGTVVAGTMLDQQLSSGGNAALLVGFFAAVAGYVVTAVVSVANVLEPPVKD